jgi:hypothetical protein
MNNILIPASFMALALPAGDSFLMTDKGMMISGQHKSAFNGASTIVLPAAVTASATPETDDPAWYNNFE